MLLKLICFDKCVVIIIAINYYEVCRYTVVIVIIMKEFEVVLLTGKTLHPY